MSKITTEVNWQYFDKLLENPKIPQMNMLEVCRFIYEATYIRYSIKFYEEMYLREKYADTIIEKNKKIEELENEIKTLKGEHVPAEVLEQDQGDS